MNCDHCKSEMDTFLEVHKDGEVIHLCDDCFDNLLDGLEVDEEEADMYTYGGII